VIAPSTLFQITVGSQHPIKQHGLIRLKSTLAADGPIRLYFVVPPDRYPSFAQQGYVTQKGVVASLRLAWCGCSERLGDSCRRGSQR
jgi:hypothetical protein